MCVCVCVYHETKELYIPYFELINKQAQGNDTCRQRVHAGKLYRKNLNI